MIYIAGISIAIFISALLLVKQQKSKSDYILLAWMLLMTFHLTLFYLHYSESIFNYPILLAIIFPLPLLHGVLLFYYVSSVTNQFPKKNYLVFIHLIPALLAYLYLIPFILLSNEEKIFIIKNNGVGYENFQILLLAAVYISGVIYVIWSIKLLNNHKKNILHQFSNIEAVNLKWLQFLTYGLGLVWIVVIFTQNDIFIFTGVSVFVILIGFFGVKQRDIFSTEKNDFVELTIESTAPEIDKKELVEAVETKASKKSKYANSGLSEKLKETYYQNMMSLVKQEKVYTNCDLSLKDLAAQLDIHANYLSQIINEKEGKNFYDFINTFRVNEFKRLIAGPKSQQFTILGLAYDCGFNSKSSFNRNFKKITGSTPSQYIQSNQQ